MLDSLSPQLLPHDALTIVYDGHTDIPVALANVSAFQCPVYQHCEPVALGYWGHGIRNKYASLLSPRDFVMHADDDDVYTPYTFDWLRRHCDRKVIATKEHDPPHTVYVIAAVWLDNHDRIHCMPSQGTKYISDRDPFVEAGSECSTYRVKKGKIGTPSGVIPFALNAMSTWGYVYGGDGDFYMQLQDVPNVTFECTNCICYVVRPITPIALSIDDFHQYSMKSTDDMISIIDSMYYTRAMVDDVPADVPADVLADVPADVLADVPVDVQSSSSPHPLTIRRDTTTSRSYSKSPHPLTIRRDKKP